jgi:spore coat protein SA
MQKVAIIAPNSLPVPPIRGGAIQTFITELLPNFREFKPYVFSNCDYGIDHLPLRETSGNIEHRRICQSPMEEFKIKLRHFALMRNYYPYVMEIIKQIREIKPDVIHLMNRPWFLPILRQHLKSEHKIILHHFNNYLMEMPKEKAWSYLKLADAFIGCSRFTVNADVVSRFPEFKDKAYVVSNGIDTDKFDPSRIDQAKLEELRHKYSITKSESVILYVGRLSEDKGAEELIRAFRKIVIEKEHRGVKLMVVGASFFGGSTNMTPFIKRLHEISRDIKDKIVFTGFISRKDIQDIFALGSIVVVPSIVHDASPNVVYEGSSMKIPVVGSVRGGIPELIENGKTGLLVNDPKDIDDLAEKILYFINNLEERRSFGEAGREYMIKNFTWKTVAAKTENVYKEVLGAK